MSWMHVMSSRRRRLVQRHLQTLALRPSVLEPELNVFGLQSRKLLPVRHPIQLLCVFEYQVMRRMGVAREPLLKNGYFRDWVDEGAVPFAPLVGGACQGQVEAAGGLAGHGPDAGEATHVLAHIHDAVAEHGVVGHHGEGQAVEVRGGAVVVLLHRVVIGHRLVVVTEAVLVVNVVVVVVGAVTVLRG